MPDKELAIWKGTLCATNTLKAPEIRMDGTAGSVLFHDGTKITEDSSNLFWNVGRTELEPHLIRITSDGSQAYPALKFNDMNTGFFKSGDSVRFSLNNSTKMTIDATGMGIGTVSPATKLEVSDDIKAKELNLIESSFPWLKFNSVMDGDNEAQFYYDVANSYSYTGPFLIQDNYGTARGLSISYEGGTPALHVDAQAGRVGIGTATPGVDLDVVQSGATIIRCRSTGSQAAIHITGSLGLLTNTAGTFFITNSAATPMIFRIASVEKMRIHSDGNVGVGVTPTLKLDVNAKSGHSDIGGICIKLTNKTGANTVQGNLVRADTATDDAFILTGANDDEYIGVVLEAGVSDGSEAWIVVHGIADVLFDDNVTAVRGNWVGTGAAGLARTQASPPALGIAAHFEEVGHSIENVTAGGGGTFILARVVLQHN